MPASQEYLGSTPDPKAPFKGGAAVTPHDTNELAKVTKSLWVGTAGDIKVKTVLGDTLTFANFSGWLDGQIVLVYSTDTTASNIVAVWG